MKRTILGLLTILLLCAGCGGGSESPAAPESSGQSAFERREFDAAYEELLPQATSGDADAQYKVGWLYLHGQGVEADYDEADQWIRKAVDQKHAEATYMLALNYELGRGVPRDSIEAYTWAVVAVSRGYPDATNLRDQVSEQLEEDEIIEARRIAQERLEQD